MVGDFLRSCVDVASRRWKIFGLLNLLFFGCTFGTAMLAGFLFPPILYSGWSLDAPEFFLANWLTMLLGIFLFNLAVSAFVVVTLPGFAFFPLSVVALLYRAILWGLLVYAAPNWLFLATLPVLILEGEAYVMAGLAGVVVGVSWFKPRWICANEKLLRVEAFKKELTECLRLYVAVVLLLFVAAVVETMTILSV